MGIRIALLLFAAAMIGSAQSPCGPGAVVNCVTISEQPGVTFVAVTGAKLAVAVYSAEVCSGIGLTASGSWGQVRQVAEAGGISVVDNVLVGPTAQLAHNKTTLHKWLIAAEIVGLSSAFAGVWQGASPWIVKAGLALTGAAQVGQQPLQASENQVQQTITTAFGAIANPSAQFNISNGACVTTALMLGGVVPKFKPIVETFGGSPSVGPPPASTIPQSIAPFNGHTDFENREPINGVLRVAADPPSHTHPAVNDAPRETAVISWEAPLPPAPFALAVQ